MASSKVEFKIKGLGSFITADVSDFPYRLNRIAFETSAKKLKSLGGTFSTSVKMSKKSKKNNVIFIGKTDIKSIGKFNQNTDYEAVIIENGSEVARGTFRLEGTSDEDYEGIFFDRDANWIDKLDKIKLNRLGYVDNKPTWLVDFNGAITFDEVNDLSNRETDFIVPTMIHNNTPVLDYLDLTDNDIWGEFDQGERVTSAVSLPSEFKVVNGFPSTLRHGLKFNHFPPAVYYRNVIERVLKEIGLSVDCALFYEDWFNALYMSYDGEKYLYNWRNIGSVYSFTPTVHQGNAASIEKIITTEPVDRQVGGNVGGTIILNRLDLPFVGGGAPTQFWIDDEQFLFKFGNIIKHDGFNPSVIDKLTLTNSFEREGAYLIPADGSYKIKVASQYESLMHDFTQHGGGGGGGGGNVYWLGASLINAFGTWDADSDPDNVPIFANRRYSWDDNVLVIMRKDSSGRTDDETQRLLFEWMNGQNKDLTTEKSDIIAYFSPKRWALNDGGIPVPTAEIMGSPYSEFKNEITIGFGGGASEFVSHELVNNSTPKHSRSTAEIEIEIDLNEGDQIEIFWVSLGNIYGEVARDPSANPSFDLAVPAEDMEQGFGASIVNQQPDPNFLTAYYSIDYLCGEYDLDLAANLPDISGKDFIGSFINQFNLHYKVNDKTISFYPVKNYYSKEAYDITSRVDISKGWKSLPIQTPKNWIVGYDNDKDDRLLVGSRKKVCSRDFETFTDYANVSFEDENTHSENTVSDLSIFSATKYFRSSIAVNPFGLGLDSFPYSFPTSVSPLNPLFVLVKGFVLGVIAANAEFVIDYPSVQSEESYKIKKFGDWSLDFGRKIRLNYHLGTANQYINGYDNDYGTLIDMPRPDIDYMNLRKHWFRPTISQFDGENATLTGINYPTLRYDTEQGLYLKFFENLIELYNLSETLELRIAITTKDWNALDGSMRVRFLDQLYRLMSIKDYDVVGRELAIIKLLKEV